MLLSQSNLVSTSLIVQMSPSSQLTILVVPLLQSISDPVQGWQTDPSDDKIISRSLIVHGLLSSQGTEDSQESSVPQGAGSPAQGIHIAPLQSRTVSISLIVQSLPSSQDCVEVGPELQSIIVPEQGVQIAPLDNNMTWVSLMVQSSLSSQFSMLSQVLSVPHGAGSPLQGTHISPLQSRIVS